MFVHTQQKWSQPHVFLKCHPRDSHASSSHPAVRHNHADLALQHNSENSVPNTISLFVLPVMPYPRQHVPFSLPYIDNSSRARCPGEHRLHGASVEAPCLSTSTLTSPHIFPKFSAPRCVASTLRRIWATTSSSKRTKPFKISQKPCTCKCSYDGKPTLKSTTKTSPSFDGRRGASPDKTCIYIYIYIYIFIY